MTMTDISYEYLLPQQKTYIMPTNTAVNISMRLSLYPWVRLPVPAATTSPAAVLVAVAATAAATLAVLVLATIVDDEHEQWSSRAEMRSPKT